MKTLYQSVVFCGLFAITTVGNAGAFTLYAGGWQQSISGDLIDVDGPKDVDSDLNIEDETNLEASITWHGQKGWVPNVRLGVFQIKASGSNTISQSGSFDLLGIPIITATGSADVATHIDYSIWNSTFFYGFKWRMFDLEAGATLNYVDGTVDATVDYDATAETAGRVDEQRHRETQSIVPTAYAAAHTQLADWLGLRLNLYGATTGSDSVGQLSLVFDANIGEGYRLYGGYRTQAIDFFDEEKDTGLDVIINGLFGGLSFSFGQP